LESEESISPRNQKQNPAPPGQKGEHSMKNKLYSENHQRSVRRRACILHTSNNLASSDHLKLLLPFFALTVLVSAYAGTSRYTITDLGTLPGHGDSYVWEQTVNNRGHVACYANDSASPNAYAGDASFLWKGPGQVEVLPGLPGAQETMVYGLNNLDQAVGLSGSDYATAHAVLWEEGRVHDLGTLPGDIQSMAELINNQGVVAGSSYNSETGVRTAVYWQDGKIYPLPFLNQVPGAAEAFGINQHSQIAGYTTVNDGNIHAALWTIHQGVVSATDLGTLGGVYSFAVAINNRGQIAGQSQTYSGEAHAALWQGGSVVDLGTFANDPFALALALNDRGQVVGFSAADLADISTGHALLWENGTTIDLQTTIPVGSDWVLGQAEGINDRGQISGIGVHNGKIRAFLLTPAGNQSGTE
jgi:probable HAF family extracellular repeat protein